MLYRIKLKCNNNNNHVNKIKKAASDAYKEVLCHHNLLSNSFGRLDCKLQKIP